MEPDSLRTLEGVEPMGRGRVFRHGQHGRMHQATGPDGRRLHAVAEIAQAVGVHRTTVYDYPYKER